MSDQDDNLDRVTARIGRAVILFFDLRLELLQTTFHVEELRTFVLASTGIIAPASPDRVMRHLRQCRYLNYEVISRSESLYRILPLDPEPPPPWSFNGDDQGNLF